VSRRKGDLHHLQFVIPAKAGTHGDFAVKQKWVPAFAGMTSRLDFFANFVCGTAH